PPRESLDKLVARLLSAVKGAERVERIEAIERRGPAALLPAARLTLQKGNADLVAHLCRAVVPGGSSLPSPAQLLPLLQAARARLGRAPVTIAAIEAAPPALGGLAPAPALLARHRELDPAQLDALARRLCERPPDEVALHVTS